MGSCIVVRVNSPRGSVWCTRARLAGGVDIYAGLDNQWGKATAEVCHRNTYEIEFKRGEANTAPESYWQPLPDGWTVAKPPRRKPQEEK